MKRENTEALNLFISWNNDTERERDRQRFEDIFSPSAMPLQAWSPKAWKLVEMNRAPNGWCLLQPASRQQQPVWRKESTDAKRSQPGQASSFHSTLQQRGYTNKNKNKQTKPNVSRFPSMRLLNKKVDSELNWIEWLM